MRVSSSIAMKRSGSLPHYMLFRNDGSNLAPDLTSLRASTNVQSDWKVICVRKHESSTSMNPPPAAPDARQAQKELQDYKHFGLEVQSRIGRGSFGTVFHCKHRTADREERACALKLIRRGSDCLLSKYGLQEVLIHKLRCPSGVLRPKPDFLPGHGVVFDYKLSSLNHPNIIGFQNLFLTQNYVGIQLQLANGGSIFSAVHSFRDSYGNGDKLFMGSTDEFALQVFQQLIVAIDFCHRNHIIIRDVKPENILIDWIDVPGHGTGLRKFPVVRLADFGLSKDVGAEGSARSLVGTRVYAAPEVGDGNQSYDYRADIWSAGGVLVYLLFKQHPFATHSHTGRLLTTADLNERKRQLLINWPVVDRRKYSVYQLRGHELIRRMLAPRAERISLQEIKSSSFFRSYAPSVALEDNSVRLKALLPSNHSTREEYIKKVMEKAQRSGAAGRGSCEGCHAAK